LDLLRITDQLYLVPAQNNGRFPFSQSVYVDAERKLLFDVGLGPKLLPAFLKEFDVDIVIVSHTHPDHIAGCGLIGRNVPIFVPRQGADSFGSLDLLAKRFIEGEEETELWKTLVLKVMGFKETQYSSIYDEKSAFELGDVKFVAMHTPGHADDHYCFYEENSGVMLLFDIDLTPMGPWYGNRESDVDRYEASMNYLRSFQPEVVVSSHMGVLRKNVDSTLERFTKRIQVRDERIAGILRSPKTVMEVASEFPFTPKFHSRLRSLFLYWESQMVRKHIDRLVGMGLATPQGDKFVKR